MGYIGVQPKAGFTSGLLDRFTSTTGTTVTLTHDIASENDIIVFVNFVKQDSTNYSVGGTGNKTLTLGGTLVSSDVVEVHYINTVKLTQAPAVGSVGSSQVSADLITGQTALSSTPADTDEFLVSDAGTLKRIDYSLIKGGGITEADTWRMTTSFTATANSTQVLSSNWERDDTYLNVNVGTGMSESSGIFSFPSTGVYQVSYIIGSKHSAGTGYLTGTIQLTTNNSAYNGVAESNSHISGVALNYNSQIAIKIFDITDTSNQKVRFVYDTGHQLTIMGGTNGNTTYVTFIRLGDT